jgi:hypothetical protein
LLLAGLLPRLFQLGSRSLWLDEGSTWAVIQQPWSVLLADMGSNAAAYPLYHLLLKGWVLLAGESEWALRLPSALAGAGAILVLALAARELQRLTSTEPRTLPGHFFPLLAVLLLILSPFAIWYAQEAKVYSLLLLVATLLLWSLARALRLRTRRAWLLFAALALLSIFVHRLAILLLLAAWAAWLAVPAPPQQQTRPHWQRVAAWLLLALASAGIVAAMAEGLGNDISPTGAAIPAPPGQALWLTFLHFSLDRGPGEFPLLWLLPWAALTGWGGALLVRDSVSRSRQQPAARVLLCFLAVPALLFFAQLAFTRLYEPRYLMLVYPAWLLLLAYPAASDATPQRVQVARLPAAPYLLMGHALLIALALLTSRAVLVQPGQGLFSGYPVKEQYREALRVLAEHLHPDDAIILHPAYVRPLYDYYMQRLTADPPPQPITFEAFKHRQMLFNQRDWDDARQRQLAGYTRSFLLIAPNHARTVDRPPTTTDEYGLVGLYFQYSREQKKWPCGIWKFNGVHLFCQDSPEAYVTGEEVRPQTRTRARFGEDITLQGYTLKATTPAGPGVYQAGGSLPITLFWDVQQQQQRDYSVFLHLCQQCDLPPAASQDGPPLDGYLPTSTWLPGKPVHDERAIPLPASLPPGRYTLLLGVYRPGDASEAARLPVQGGDVLKNNRLVLETVEIVAPQHQVNVYNNSKKKIQMERMANTAEERRGGECDAAEHRQRASR